jgi:hypothetical protein
MARRLIQARAVCVCSGCAPRPVFVFLNAAWAATGRRDLSRRADAYRRSDKVKGSERLARSVEAWAAQ